MHGDYQPAFNGGVPEGSTSLLGRAPPGFGDTRDLSGAPRVEIALGGFSNLPVAPQGPPPLPMAPPLYAAGLLQGSAPLQRNLGMAPPPGFESQAQPFQTDNTVDMQPAAETAPRDLPVEPAELPYDGDLDAAMKAQDRDAIRILMQVRDSTPRTRVTS